MKICNYQPINYININFKSIRNDSKPFGLKRLTRDVFERTTISIQKSRKIDSLNKKEIETIYSEIYEKTLDFMPVLSELGIEKPKLIIKDDLSVTAAYDFPSNAIEINSGFLETIYAYNVYDKHDDVVTSGIAFEQNLEEKSEELKELFSRIETIKLNKDEKTLYLKAILAHEFRHWAQEHIIASTKGCEAVFDNKLQKINKLVNTLEKLLVLARENKLGYKRIKEAQAQLAQAKKQYAYILNYTPKQVLDDDFKLSLSIIPWEQEYWSIKNHLLPASLRYSNSNTEEYMHNPIEIDAYYYQAEILISEKEKHSDIRENIYEAMIIPCMRKGMLRSEKVEEYGYPPLLSD